MAKKKGKKQKKGLPEGTPLEKYETAEMNLKELKKYAIKMGFALNQVRIERCNLEIDRDKMLRNLVNVVCRHTLINREIRRLERELINNENIFEITMVQKNNELAELRFRQVPQYYRSKNDLFVTGYEAKKQIFMKQDQMFKDRYGLNSDYYKKCLDLEGTFMAAKHNALCDKMDKLNENNISQMLWIEKKYQQIEEKKLSIKHADYVRDMVMIVNKKENIIENIQKDHISGNVDILRSFEDIMKYNFTVINELSKDIKHTKRNDLRISKEYTEVKKKYDVYCALVNEAEKDLYKIQPVIEHLHHCRAASLVNSKKLAKTEEQITNAELEIDLLEEFIRKDEECTKKLKGIVIRDILSFRQMQVKTHLFMMNLCTKIEEMFADRVNIGKSPLRPIEVNLEPFNDLYQRYNCYRKSMIDIVERVLRSNFSNLPALGFQMESPPILPKIPLLSTPSKLAETGREKLQTGVPSVFRLPKFKTPPPKLYKLITSLPRVPIRSTATHVLPYMTVKGAS